MPKSNFGRFVDGVQISGVNLNVHQKGKVFYVCNSTTAAPRGVVGSDSSDGLTPEHPLATIDAAINKCTASRGDKIIVMPGHAESVTATSIVMDTAGVSIIGQGEGALKPTLNFGATTSNIAVSAANCSMEGLLLVSTIDSVVAGITVSAAGCRFDLESKDTSSLIEFVSVIVTTAAANNLKVKLRHRGDVGGNAMVRCIDVVGADDAEIDIDFYGIASTAAVSLRTTASTNVRVTGTFYNESAALTKNVTDAASSNWSVVGFDAKAGREFAGSDDEAVHYTNTTMSLDTTGNPVGVDDADNAFASTNVVANRDGSVLERLEHILDCIVDDETTNLIGVNDADNAATTSSVVANVDGSIVERLEALMDPLGGYDPVLGFRVTKTSNLADGSGTDNLFTVTGRCLITHLSGEVTTVVGTTTTMKIRDVTNSIDLCAATTITTDDPGTMYHLDGVKSAVLNSGIAPVIGSTSLANGGYQPIIVGGTVAPITLAHVLDGAGTGAVAWVLYYKPLVASATVAAAA